MEVFSGINFNENNLRPMLGLQLKYGIGPVLILDSPARASPSRPYLLTLGYCDIASSTLSAVSRLLPNLSSMVSVNNRSDMQTKIVHCKEISWQDQ